MPDLRTIVDRMIEAGDSDEDIEGVIERFHELHPRSKKAEESPKTDFSLKDEYKGPDTFWGGVKEAMKFGGEVDKAAASGALGWLKGAVADIPETLWTAAKDAASVVAHPIQTAKDAPAAFGEGIPAAAKQMWETTANAGADPESFGRMTGQLTGQPLVTAKVAPYVRPVVGATVEGVGRGMRKYQPMTGVMPRMAEPRLLRNIERGVGRGVENLGQRIRGTYKPPEPPINPNAGGALVREKAPAVEDVFADAIQEIRNESNRAPSVEAAPPPYDRGAPLTRTDSPNMSRFGTPLKTKAELAESTGPTKKNNAAPKKTAPKEKFEPSVDPATREILNEAPTEPPTPRTTRSKGRFTPTIEPVTTTAETPESIVSASGLSPELKARILDKVKNLFNADNVEGSAIIPEAANNLATRVSRAFDRIKGGKSPTAPDIPEGQVTNRSMFERSAQVGAENAAASRAASEQSLFSDVPGASEFSPDLYQFSDDVFEGVSPRFAAPLRSFEDIQTRMYELMDKDAAGTLTGPELAEAQQLNKQWRNHPEFGAEAAPETVPEPTPEPSIWDRINNFIADESGELDTSKLPKPRLRKGDKLIEPKELGEVASNKPVGPKGEAWTVHDPNGNHLGDISVTPEDIAEALKTPGLEDIDPKDMARAMYDAKLEELLDSHGLKNDDIPRMKIAAKDKRVKRTETTAKPKTETVPRQEDLPESDVPVEQKKSISGKVDPEAAFGRGGDIRPIENAASELDKTGATDLKYKPLLPKSMQFGLGEGETFRSRLANLLGVVREEVNPELLEAASQRMAERDAFIESIKNPMGSEPASKVPLLDLSKIDITKLKKGKINQQPSPWISPRLQQQHPGLARLLKGQKK